MFSRKLNFEYPDLLENKLSFSDVYPTSTGVGCDIEFAELRLRKTLKSKDLGLLKLKLEDTLFSWEKKYQRHLAKKQKEKDRKFKEQQSEIVDLLNREVEQTVNELDRILLATLDVNDALDWRTLKRQDEFSIVPGELFEQGQSPEYFHFNNAGKPHNFIKERSPSKPTFQAYIKGHGFLSRIFRREALRKKFTAHLKQWQNIVEQIEVENNQRKDLFEQTSLKFEHCLHAFEEAKKLHNDSLEDLKDDYSNHKQGGVEEYCDIVLNNSVYPDFFPKTWELEYREDNRIAVLNYDLPPPENFPDTESYKYIKSRDKITEKKRPVAKQKNIYDKTIYQICIRTIHELFEADVIKALDAVAFNGLVTTTNPATGKLETKTIISVSADKEAFLQFDLSKVDPKETFRFLKGVSAVSLMELTPIPPVIQLEKNDRRIVEGREVVHELDSSVNLAAMDWQEFEHLIREIFEKEFASNGGEVNVTQASSDGGVDAIAFDPDPIRGGKIVIQAKRYTNVVGVAYVRDLYGTVMNEGAIKGILVTTSHYGNDAYEFAKGKPLSLLNGSNLLSMLEKHGHSARIDVAEAKKLLKE